MLLAPAAASWDQYPSFEARGDAFRRPYYPLFKRSCMTYIARNDTSIVGRWWNEIDQTLLVHFGGHYAGLADYVHRVCANGAGRIANHVEFFGAQADLCHFGGAGRLCCFHAAR